MTSSAATILIVDDEIENRRLLEVLLRPEGYLTLSAANGEEALASIAERAPDLILLDIMMPGMDGYQVAGILKANPATSNIPIIMVTALIDRNARLAGLDAGVEEFLTKPVDRAELWLRVRNLLRLKELGDFHQNHNLILEQEVQARTADLRESERRFSDMLGNVELVSVMLDREARITYCNDYLLRLTGWRREEVIGRDWFELFIPSEINDQVKDIFSTLIADLPGEWHREKEILTRSGERRLIRWNNSVLRSGAGDVIGTASIGEDITERKHAEEELLARELRYRAVVTSAPNAFVTSDSAGRIVGWNPSAERIFGYAETEVIGQPLTLLIPQRFQDRHLDGMKRVQSGGERRAIGKTVELAGRRKDASEFPLELSLSEWTAGGVRFFNGIIRDITERKAAEESLRAAEEQFRGLVEQSIAGIYIIQDGKLIYVNPRCAEIVGRSSMDELIGTDPLRWVAEVDRGNVAESMRRLLDGEAQSIALDFGVLRGDGVTIQVGANAARATHEGQPAIIGMLQDISEKKRSEDEIQRYVEQLKNAFMSTVEVATIISEMRDPYTAGHERRVAEIAAAIGAELGFDAQRIEGLQVAGHLHDIGKMTIPIEILSKSGKLSAIEFRLIQGHAQASYDVLKAVEWPWPVAQVALQHHERMDGSGYPQGLKGEAILLEARIMAAADVVEAMASHRPYRAALGIEKALAEIERGRGSAYDLVVADACLKLFREKSYTIPA